MPRLDQATIRTVRHALVTFTRVPNPTNLKNLQEIVLAIEPLQDDPVKAAPKDEPTPAPKKKAASKKSEADES